jgi:outer membrane receptor protein involved in Fe transport
MRRSRLLQALGLALAALAGGAPAFGQGLGFPVVGTVVAKDGAPIAGALVTLSGAGVTKSARSDARGRLDFGKLPAATYGVAASATGFAPLRDRTIAVRAGEINRIALTLERARASSLLVIGQVNANGTAALSTAPVPSVNINAQQYAAQGVARVSDILDDQLSTTVYPILGGGLNAPAVVALRGPDPSETLVDVDGHQVNNGSTGDFDLSLLDPANLESVQVVYGIAPSALYGPNTLGGALNVVTLEPSTVPTTLERFSIGSYDTFAETIQATGTDNRWGYAFSVHRMTSGGQLDDYSFPNTTDSETLTSNGYSPIGNDMSALSDIAKLRYTFGNGGYVGLSFYDQAVYRDLSGTLSSEWLPQNGAPGGVVNYSNFSGSSVGSNDDAYGLDLSLPLGPLNPDKTAATTLLFRHQTSLVSQVVNGAAAGSSPYLYNNRDLIADDTLEIDRQLPHASLSFKAAMTNEDLVTDNILGTIYADAAPVRRAPIGPDAIGSEAISPDDSVTQSDPDATVQYLGQTQRWLGARYTDDPTSHLHYSFATYYSDYSTFGHSVDPRFGFVWTPDADSALRASAGSTFQSPQLPTFIVPAPKTPIPVVGGYASIGNPNATAERSTEYDLGYEHLLHVAAHPIHVAMDLYRTDLHNGVADFFGPKPCNAQYVELEDNPTCLTYPVNVTREVYQGVELRGEAALTHDLTLRADYDVDSVYTQSVPLDALDGVVPFEQALGVPLHKFVLTLEHLPNLGLCYYAGLLHEGDYNELNLPPFTTLRAGIGWRTRDYEIMLAGENLTNTYNFLITQEQGGVPYGAVPAAILPNAYPLPGRQITLIVTRRT